MSSRPQRSELDPRPARHPIVTPAQNRVPLTPSHVKSPALSFPVGQITKALASPSLLYKYLPPPYLLFFLHPLEPSPSPCAASIFLGHLHLPGPPPSSWATSIPLSHRHPLQSSPSPSAISAPLSYPKDSPILIFWVFPSLYVLCLVAVSAAHQWHFSELPISIALRGGDCASAAFRYLGCLIFDLPSRFISPFFFFFFFFLLAIVFLAAERGDEGKV